jgi:hypothetical protein
MTSLLTYSVNSNSTDPNQIPNLDMLRPTLLLRTYLRNSMDRKCSLEEDFTLQELLARCASL